MEQIKLFCDGSVNPQQKIGYGAYLVYTNIDTLESAKEKIHTKRFIDTSSTKLELEVLLWALDDVVLQNKEISIYTDCQNILGLENRREKLESNNYKSAKGKLLNNHKLYKQFYKKIDKLNCTFIKVKGHKPSKEKDSIDDLFTLVDRGSRDALRSRAFTLFEVLISLVILSVVIFSLTKLYTKDNSIERYYELQSIENKYIETKTIQSSENIKLIHN